MNTPKKSFNLGGVVLSSPHSSLRVEPRKKGGERWKVIILKLSFSVRTSLITTCPAEILPPVLRILCFYRTFNQLTCHILCLFVWSIFCLPH